MKPRVEIGNVWKVAWCIVAVLLIVLALLTTLFAYSAADIRAVCSGHQGVAQVVDNTWSSGPDRATIVCRDGYVGDIQ